MYVHVSLFSCENYCECGDILLSINVIAEFCGVSGENQVTVGSGHVLEVMKSMSIVHLILWKQRQHSC